MFIVPFPGLLPLPPLFLNSNFTLILSFSLSSSPIFSFPRERVFVKKSSELFSDGKISSLKFSLDGKYLSIGFSQGSLLLVDIEFGQTFEQSFHQNQDNQSGSPSQQTSFSLSEDKEEDPSTSSNKNAISQLWWVALTPLSSSASTSSSSSSSSSSSTSFASSVPSFDAFQVDELFDNEIDSQLQGLQRCFQQLQNSLLMVLLEDNSFFVLAYGMEIIWKTKLPFDIDKSSSLGPIILGNSLYLQRNSSSTSSLPNSQLEFISLISSSFLSYSLELKRLSFLSLMFSFYQKKLEDTVSSLSKKWKDCLKTLSPKITLLQGLLTGYEMKMTPIEFLHSVTLCGLWHPVAHTSFSQHWNEQGISRLNSSIDSTTKYILRCLQFKIYPMIINMFFLVK